MGDLRLLFSGATRSSLPCLALDVVDAGGLRALDPFLADELLCDRKTTRMRLLDVSANTAAHLADMPH